MPVARSRSSAQLPQELGDERTLSARILVSEEREPTVSEHSDAVQLMKKQIFLTPPTPEADQKWRKARSYGAFR